MIGTIPSELGQLDELEVISLSLNKLSGTIPSEIGNLVKLEKLNLELNSLTGTVPSTLGRLANLGKLLVSIIMHFEQSVQNIALTFR